MCRNQDRYDHDDYQAILSPSVYSTATGFGEPRLQGVPFGQWTDSTRLAQVFPGFERDRRRVALVISWLRLVFLSVRTQGMFWA